jgi:putative oxidoreductase
MAMMTAPGPGRVDMHLALLALRLTTGTLLAGHGSQKLFGAFGGGGLDGTAGMMESLGLRPGRPWAALAGLAELGGGALTALGFLSPLGPTGILSAMAMATATAHWGKPIWVTKGGAELPVTNMAIALALAIAGPGRCSLDAALGIRVPPKLVALTIAGAVAGGVLGLVRPDAFLAIEREELPTRQQVAERRDGSSTG